MVVAGGVSEDFFDLGVVGLGGFDAVGVGEGLGDETAHEAVAVGGGEKCGAVAGDVAVGVAVAEGLAGVNGEADGFFASLARGDFVDVTPGAGGVEIFEGKTVGVDIAVAGGGSNKVFWFENNGSASFTERIIDGSLDNQIASSKTKRAHNGLFVATASTRAGLSRIRRSLVKTMITGLLT